MNYSKEMVVFANKLYFLQPLYGNFFVKEKFENSNLYSIMFIVDKFHKS